MSDFKIIKLVDNPVHIKFSGGVNPTGEYASGITYNLGDSVSYQGSSYVAIQETTGNLPTDITYWQLLSLKGDGGTIGGTAGQILAKANNDDFDNEWIDNEFPSSPAYGILSDDIENWDIAFGWGNHAGLYSLLNHNHNGVYSLIGHNHTGVYEPIGTASTLLSGHLDSYDHDLISTALQSETDPVWNSEKANYALLSQVWKLNGNTVGAKKTIGSLDNFDFGILTNNNERITVLANGNVGIGTTTPAYKLDVSSASTGVVPLVQVKSGGGGFIMGSYGSSWGGMWSSGVTPTISNYNMLVHPTIGLAFNAPTGGMLQFLINDSPKMAMNVNGLAINNGATGPAAGNGLIVTTGNVGIGITTPTAKLDINSDILRLRTAKTPATAGASGNQGDIAWDANYIYICTATNTWKRSAIATW